jgi:hypothetical protein
MDQPPVYEFETAFFKVLGVEYETGARYKKLGLIRADALCQDGRALYLLDSNAIRETQARIRDYRRNRTRTQHNLPLCHA